MSSLCAPMHRSDKGPLRSLPQLTSSTGGEATTVSIEFGLCPRQWTTMGEVERPARRRPAVEALSSASDELLSAETIRSFLRSVADRVPPYTAGWLRVRLLRAGGLAIGARSMVGGRLRLAGGLDPASRVHIGDDCFINDGCRFDTSARITIDDGAYLGHDVAVLTSSHELGPPDRRAGTFSCAPIHSGRGSWIGARAVLLPGVTIGDGAVVAAGAVVTRAVPANVVVGGVPAEFLRQISG